MNEHDRQRRHPDDLSSPPLQRSPGKRTLVDAQYATRAAAPMPQPVQLLVGAAPAHDDPFAMHLQDTAARGVAGAGGELPHQAAIQRSFGHHDISGVSAHVGGAAASACDEIGAQAYATGSSTAFAAAPDLHTAAHEAAHTVQQRGGVQLKGGVGETGDQHERHADAVADAVVGGRSAQGLLDDYAPATATSATQLKAVQLKGEPTLRNGSSGKAVKKLQQRLNAKETVEPPLGVDGTFGDRTEAAVIAFQHKHTDTTGVKLDEDGVVGKLTWGAINLEHETPEIANTDEALGEHVAKEMNRNNEDPHEANRGVHYDFNYKASFPDKWKDEWSQGYADPTYFEHLGFMDWRLKPGKSASAALQSWLHGLTIAECLVAIIAIENDAVRAAIGDQKFDAHYGSTDKKVPQDQRLRIRQGWKGTIAEIAMKDSDEAAANDGGSFGDRPVEVGDWCYFYNHPKYLLKHPGGAYQGENAVYLGRNDAGAQLFSGMGVSRVVEREMLEKMRDDYDRPRDEWDEQRLARIKENNGGVLPSMYDPASNEFPDELDEVDDIVNAPEYELNGTKRKGGFVAHSVARLDTAKVAALK